MNTKRYLLALHCSGPSPPQKSADQTHSNYYQHREGRRHETRKPISKSTSRVGWGELREEEKSNVGTDEDGAEEDCSEPDCEVLGFFPRLVKVVV